MTLTQYLEQTQTTPTAFARTLGVSHTTVLRWLSGETNPPLPVMSRIAETTGGAVMPNDFMMVRA